MNMNVIRDVVTRKQKGAFTSLLWERPLPVRKAFADNIVTKRTSAVVRFGIEYDNMGSVQEKRANGELPATNDGLKWGEWSLYPYFIKHKGKNYLRCTEAQNSPIHTEYFLNGKKVRREAVEPICTKAAFTDHSKLDVFTIDCDNILAIR